MTDHSADALLTDTRWLRRVTRGLVRDPDLAEDVAQETLLAAQTHPAGKERSWLARVARNLAVSLLRREARRTRAESVAYKDGAAPPPDELLAEAELQRAAVDALMELDEPYRRTLLLRFMKGLSPRAVARQMGVPLETVRTRQKRGLAQLRARLDQRSGGRLALILPLAVPGWPFPTTATLWGFVLMKTKVGITSAVLLLLTAMFGGIAWAGQGDEGYQPQPATVMNTQSALPEAPKAPDELSDSSNREVVPAEAPPNNTAPGAETGSLLVSVIWQDTRKPAANVCVRVVQWHDERTRQLGHQIPRMLTTGPQGTVRFESLAPGRAGVVTDRFFHTHAVNIRGGVENRHNFCLAPGLDVRGIVVDFVGNPVGDAEVLTLLGGISPEWTHKVATTSADGRFFLRGLHKYTSVGARRPGGGVSDFILLLYPKPAEDGIADVRLVVPQDSAVLRGVVLNAAGGPVPDAWVKVRQKRRGREGGWIGPPVSHLATDARGVFEVRTLRPGSASLRVFSRGHAPHKSEIKCDAFQPTDVSVRLTPGSTLAGRVLDDRGYPVAQADVNLARMEHPTKSYARTDADGAFRIVDLPAGRHLVKVKSKVAGTLDEEVELPIGKTLQHDFKLSVGRTIRGVLVDERGQPLVGWWLSEYGNKQLDTAKTDKDGRFCFTNCEDRNHEVAVRQDWGFRLGGLITVLRDVRPDGQERTYQVADALLPSAVLRGRVFAANGKPLKGAVISVKKGDARYWQQVANTDADGRFETLKVSPGTYKLIIGHIRHVAHNRTDILVTRNGSILLDDVVLKKRE